MSLGGRDDIYPAANAYVSPTPASGGRNRYAEIMAQYAQTQPFSFFGYPQSYTGGYGGYPSDYTGGFTPYQRPAPAPRLPVEIPTTSTTGGAGGNNANREGPSAWSQMTPAERAAYYAANPIAGSIALGMQDLFGNLTLPGQAAKYLGADGWYDSRLEKLGLDPESFAYGPPDPNFSSQAAAAARNEALQAAITAANAEGAGLVANPMSVDPAQQAQAEANAAAAAQAAQQAADARADAESRDSNRVGADVGSVGDASTMSPGGGYFSEGGHVSMQRLQGPNPAGPDDGYAALKDGEYVINDKAVKKYGIELMEAINSGKISKGKLRGLLEM